MESSRRQSVGAGEEGNSPHAIDLSLCAPKGNQEILWRWNLFRVDDDNMKCTQKLTEMLSFIKVFKISAYFWVRILEIAYFRVFPTTKFGLVVSLVSTQVIETMAACVCGKGWLGTFSLFYTIDS